MCCPAVSWGASLCGWVAVGIWGAQRVGARGAVVGDDCVVLVEGDRVSGSDDVMDADECCAKSIGDDR